MNPDTRAEFEKLSKAQQEWALEVERLLGMLTADQQQAALDLARLMAACNTHPQVVKSGKEAAV